MKEETMLKGSILKIFGGITLAFLATVAFYSDGAAQDTAGTQCQACHSEVESVAIPPHVVLPGPTDGIYGEPSFMDLVFVDTLPNREVVFEYDIDHDGRVDTVVHRAQQEFIPIGVPCQDYDPQYILVPRDGYYRVRREPNQIRAVPARTSFVGGGR
jgi:hypothetical protein